MKSAGSVESAFASGYCYGYLEGLLNAGKLANTFVAKPELRGHQLWCVPEDENLESVANSVVSGLKSNAEEGRALYEVAVMRILLQHYPCS